MKYLFKILIFLIALYLFLYYFIFKQDYVNASQIIKKQVLSVLKRKNERRKSDILAFINIYIIPLVLAVLVSMDNLLDKKFYDNVIVILAILVSVFLTLISILTAKSYKNKNDRQKKIVNITFNNVYFLTIISIILIIFCFLKTSFLNLSIPFLTSVNWEIIFNVIIIYLILLIFIHLLIVLKRIEQIFFITFED